jgi:hypothetical protein
MNTFPIYLLRLGGDWEVVFTNDRADIGHTDFWEQNLSQIVAKHYGIPQKRLDNLPYCQWRARVVGNTVYYGGKHDPQLLKTIRNELGDASLVFVHDNHEKRLLVDVREFRRLVRRRGL